MSRVFVTGALGVIGSYLVPLLRKRGFDVISSDVHVRDYSDYVRADVTSFEDLYRIFKKQDIDMVIHMAGEVGRMVGEEHPQKMMYVNNIGTLNLIKFCLEYGSRMLYFSTSEVYGTLFDEGTPVKEEDLEKKGTAFVTTNIYAMSKLFGEAIVRHYVKNYDLNAITVRPFMVYGPGERPSKYRSAISNFVQAGLLGKKITVHRGAERAWCYISDFVEGFLLAANQPFHGKYEAFNIGSEEFHTMEETAKIVIDECGGSPDQIEVVDPPEKFLSLTKRFSIDKIKSRGFTPRVTLREGIKEVAQWQRKALSTH